ncbi:MAG: GTP-binding protein EngB [Desulfuromonadaceae bacterium]
MEVPRIPYQELSQQHQPESSASIRARVEAARGIQQQRFSKLKIHSNSQMEARHIRTYCPIDGAGDKLLEMVTDRLGLSARSYARILKVARTIADLAGEEHILQPHLSEAVQYRGLDRKMF